MQTKFLRKISSNRMVFTRKRPHINEIDKFIETINSAMTIQMIELERNGVDAAFAITIATSMHVPINQFYEMIGIPRATAELRASKKKMINGSSGYSVIGIIKLLGIAKNMAANSRKFSASTFDYAIWLGEWLRMPQLSLGGSTPAELLDTPAGVAVIVKALSAAESGSYL